MKWPGVENALALFLPLFLYSARRKVRQQSPVEACSALFFGRTATSSGSFTT